MVLAEKLGKDAMPLGGKYMKKNGIPYIFEN